MATSGENNVVPSVVARASEKVRKTLGFTSRSGFQACESSLHRRRRI